MRLLFLTQYYPPETGAASNRISDLANRLASFGHEVTVLAPMPNYLQGRILPGYRGRLLMEEHRQAVRVVRTWLYARESQGITGRLLNYFSFMLTSLIGAWLKLDRQDVVFVASPPLFLGISGLLLKWCWRAKMVLNISDLWPSSAVDMGVVTNSKVIRLATALEQVLYRHSDLITGQTQGIVTHIQQRVHTPVILCTNGVDPSSALSGGNRGEARRRFGLSADDFVVGYAGLHGLAQALDFILAAAAEMREHRDVKFVFFGDGPERKRLMKMADHYRLDNVRFFNTQPKARMPEIMNVIDVSLVPLRRLELFKGALPSKMFEAMGSGVPVIVSIEGEAKDLVERAHGGLCIPPEDPRALIESVLFLRDHPELREKMGNRGRQFISAHYDRRIIAERVENALLELWPSPSSATDPVATEG
jgi:glycosyltransferase involved in cell wall biosynthesis